MSNWQSTDGPQYNLPQVDVYPNQVTVSNNLQVSPYGLTTLATLDTLEEAMTWIRENVAPNKGFGRAGVYAMAIQWHGNVNLPWNEQARD